MDVLVGITGYKGAGKDIVGSAFTDLGFETVKFADCLKGMLSWMLVYRGAPMDDVERMIEGDLKETPTPYFEGKTPREAMQWLGTEWGRDLIGPDVWKNAFKDAALSRSLVVCTDMRFPNENNLIKELGGYRIRVTRPDKQPNEFSLHESEAYITSMEVDYEITNDATIEQLKSAANIAAANISDSAIYDTMRWDQNNEGC